MPTDRFGAIFVSFFLPASYISAKCRFLRALPWLGLGFSTLTCDLQQESVSALNLMYRCISEVLYILHFIALKQSFHRRMWQEVRTETLVDEKGQLCKTVVEMLVFNPLLNALGAVAIATRSVAKKVPGMHYHSLTQKCS